MTSNLREKERRRKRKEEEKRGRKEELIIQNMSLLIKYASPTIVQLLRVEYLIYISFKIIVLFRAGDKNKENSLILVPSCIMTVYIYNVNDSMYV